MKIVATNTPEDIGRASGEREIWRTVRVLAVNLLRVIRGAGKPHRLPDEAEAFADAVRAYREAWGHWPRPG